MERFTCKYKLGCQGRLGIACSLLFGRRKRPENSSEQAKMERPTLSHMFSTLESNMNRPINGRSRRVVLCVVPLMLSLSRSSLRSPSHVVTLALSLFLSPLSPSLSSSLSPSQESCCGFDFGAKNPRGNSI